MNVEFRSVYWLKLEYRLSSYWESHLLHISRFDGISL